MASGLSAETLQIRLDLHSTRKINLEVYQLEYINIKLQFSSKQLKYHEKLQFLSQLPKQ